MTIVFNTKVLRDTMCTQYRFNETEHNTQFFKRNTLTYVVVDTVWNLVTQHPRHESLVSAKYSINNAYRPNAHLLDILMHYIILILYNISLNPNPKS